MTTTGAEMDGYDLDYAKQTGVHPGPAIAGATLLLGAVLMIAGILWP